MKALKVVAGILGFALIQTALRENGIMLGAIPATLLSAIFIAPLSKALKRDKHRKHQPGV